MSKLRVHHTPCGQVVDHKVEELELIGSQSAIVEKCSELNGLRKPGRPRAGCQG